MGASFFDIDILNERERRPFATGHVMRHNRTRQSCRSKGTLMTLFEASDPLARFVVGPKYHHVFADYALADIPPIPAGWSDVSWKNDACPCWRVDSQGSTFYVFADYADENKRDFGPGVARFSISADMAWDNSRATVFDTDDWDALITALEMPRLPVSLSDDVVIGVAPNKTWAWLVAEAYFESYRMSDQGHRLGLTSRGTWIDEDNGQTVEGWIVPLMPQGEEA